LKRAIERICVLKPRRTSSLNQVFVKRNSR
jgi:hypothetical protein